MDGNRFQECIISSKICIECNDNPAQPGRKICRTCRATARRKERAVSPKIKQKEKEAYNAKKDDPDFKKKNQERAREWNANNKDRRNANKRRYRKKD